MENSKSGMPLISGIQQVGIGVPDVHQAWKWYREFFGTDIRIFEDKAEAKLMLPYTGNEPRGRHAALAINMQGGGGFEIWQYTERIPMPPQHPVLTGDLGINAVKIKARDVQQTHRYFKTRNGNPSPVFRDPAGQETFFIRDPYENLFQIVPGNDWFLKNKRHTGAVYGTMHGVSDIENARKVYSGILGYDETLYDVTGTFDDLAHLPGGNLRMRRVLLKHSKKRKGSFSALFGSSQIELIQVLDRQPRRIFEDRFWGDLGFIHLCFDISGMDALRNLCEEKGFPFTVDSFANMNGKFDMGEAAGHFAYIEDPDGTLIEFVETLRVPIVKKLGIYLNLQKRNPEKSLPRWMIRALALGRIRD
jgi:catechol 2,3-dioxygenase-like lactoylglutathione lyase family enzyme